MRSRASCEDRSAEKDIGVLLHTQQLSPPVGHAGS
ncbi:unnamed protein product, partial [Ectocarpus sp. 13 AM-2016]